MALEDKQTAKRKAHNGVGRTRGDPKRAKNTDKYNKETRARGKFNKETGAGGKFNKEAGAGGKFNKPQAAGNSKGSTEGVEKIRHRDVWYTKAEPIWFKARSRSGTKAEKAQQTAELIALASDRLDKLYTHPVGSRMLQTILKNGSKDQVHQLAADLEPFFENMLTNACGQRMIEKIMEASPKSRPAMIEIISGKVQKLITNAAQSPIVEMVYLQSTAQQRQYLAQEFLGAEFALFKDPKNPITLEHVIKTQPLKREFVFKNIFKCIENAVNKETLTSAVIHRVILDCFTFGEQAEIDTLLDMLKESFVHIIHTRDGARAAMLAIVKCTSNKTRKTIIKSFKPFLLKIATEEFGHMVLLQLFDTIDDTVLLGHDIVTPLTKELGQLIKTQEGRHLIMYPYIGMSNKHITKPVLQLIIENSEFRNQTSKKESHIREAEIRKVLDPFLSAYLRKNFEEVIYAENQDRVIIEFILNTSSDVGPFKELIADMLNSTSTKGDTILTNVQSVHVLKRLILAETGVLPAHVTKDTPFEISELVYKNMEKSLAEHAVSVASPIVAALTTHKKFGPKILKRIKGSRSEIQKAADEGNAGSKKLLESLGAK
ncbi:armadillo-type protein [Dimargaris cristalligena]|uniref:Armadillo-type protein n=1 Tax=Dimargaris cristalligena TaxID=215637 RepID=A0A4Q0A2R5_9FUNG|nr:armadillo-type protein [Dimargaris cristalligena]|eukprot:RKP40128.1 armadillo-type protein [Dimargaris cristalligena]